ncbi:unnamed protein product [Nippostrongylus brasiliensis]|uniref:Uncharacterized protein n=1 Tax=Nippostrongylus brasiliensis TaxID=27835 RepID=A0A0N4XV17_NIPBR|nr:unnamed protein product [Nippostrongylus brasiliensis]
MEKKSYRSLQSGPSTITSTSAFDSPESIFTVALLDSDPVLITKHPPTLLASSALDNCLKVCRQIDYTAAAFAKSSKLPDFLLSVRNIALPQV